MCKEISCIMPCIMKIFPPAKRFEYTNAITSRLVNQGYDNSNDLESVKKIVFYNYTFISLQNKIAFLGRYIYFAFPPTSISIGINILRITYEANGPLGRKIAYTIFGCIATLGLGIIIVAIQLFCSLFINILYALIALAAKYNCYNLEKKLNEISVWTCT